MKSNCLFKKVHSKKCSLTSISLKEFSRAIKSYRKSRYSKYQENTKKFTQTKIQNVFKYYKETTITNNIHEKNLL